MAVMLHPEIQSRAQEEIDAVTGRVRLPGFEDRPRLPFVDAICKEVLRWRPALPLGEFSINPSITYSKASRATAVPHAATEDNVYEGLFIPKGWSPHLGVRMSFADHQPIFSGALVIGNAWCGFYRIVLHLFGLAYIVLRAILHDEAMYPEPDAFKPERFLNADGTLRDDPILASTFGFGKRICPGRHFVDATLFIVVASLLSVFKFEKGKGAGDTLDSYRYTGGTVRYVQSSYMPSESPA
jgi:hypothetical protein